MSAFDPSPLEEIRALDPDMGADLVREIVDVYLDDAPNRCTDISTTAAAGDASALHRATHTLKGSSANVGLMDLHEACRILDDEVRDGSLPPDLTAKVAAIENAHVAGLEHLKGYLASL